MALQMITLKQLSAKLGGRSRASIYNDMAAGRIPAPVKIGARNYWRESDIDALFGGEVTS